MANFEIALAYVLNIEKGLSENSKDRGGITNRGISLRFLRNIPIERLRTYGIYEEPNEQTIRDLNLDQASKIYYGEWWLHAPFDMIINQNIANYLFGMAINMGISPAVKCLQRACWSAFGKQNEPIDDGILGGITLKIINECSNFVTDIVAAMRSEIAGDYRLIVALHPEQREFLNGWLRRAYEE